MRCNRAEKTSNCCVKQTRYSVVMHSATRRRSHVTRHTSHVTRHTSHVTRHTSHTPAHVHVRYMIFEVIVAFALQKAA